MHKHILVPAILLAMAACQPGAKKDAASDSTATPAPSPETTALGQTI